jgi:hypothetical protein
MPFRTVTQHLSGYRGSLHRGDVPGVCAAVQDRSWLDALKITQAERRATNTYLDQIGLHLTCDPRPDVEAALEVISQAQAFWLHPDRFSTS